MSNRALFRLSVIGILLFEILISIALFVFDDGSLDAAWEALPESIDWVLIFESYAVVSIIAGVSVIILLLASVIGVLLFQNWARWLYLGSTLLVFPISIFSGPTIYYAWESSLWDIALMAEGAVMLVMFMPPIRNEFNKSSKRDAASGAPS